MATPDDARVSPDVAFLSQASLAGGGTGVAVFDGTNSGGIAGWQGLIGTSLASPMFAATVALANQVRAAAGESTIGENLDPSIYYMGAEYTGRDFKAVNPAAGGGFDPALTTGWGEPVVPAFINDLATLNQTESPNAVPQDVNVNNVQLKMTATEYFGINSPNSSNFTQPDNFPGTSDTLVEIPGQITEVPIFQSGDFGTATSIAPGIIDLTLPAYDTVGNPLFADTGLNPLDTANQFDIGDFNVNLQTGQFSGVTTIDLDDVAEGVDVLESPTAATSVNGTLVEPYGMGLFVQGTVSNNGNNVSGSFYTVVFNQDGTFKPLGVAGSSDVLPDLEGSFSS